MDIIGSGRWIFYIFYAFSELISRRMSETICDVLFNIWHLIKGITAFSLYLVFEASSFREGVLLFGSGCV